MAWDPQKGLEEALAKFAVSGAMYSRALGNAAAAGGGRIAPQILSHVASQPRAALNPGLSAAARAPGALTPTPAQKSLQAMMHAVPYAGSEFGEAGGQAAYHAALQQHGKVTGALPAIHTPAPAPPPAWATDATAIGKRPVRKTAAILPSLELAFTLGHEKAVDRYLSKEGASALRSRIQMASGGGKSIATLGGKPVGVLDIAGGHVRGASIDPKMQGLGLGKKLYGETMRRQPGAELSSDTLGTSSSAQRVWEGMRQRPGYNVHVTPGFENTGTPEKPFYRPAPGVTPTKRNIFTANLPAQAQRPSAPMATPALQDAAEDLLHSVPMGKGREQAPDTLHAEISARRPGAFVRRGPLKPGEK